MFEVKDECSIPVPFHDRCGHGITECKGKACVKYVMPNHLRDRFQRETELKAWENDYEALGKKIAQRKVDLKITEDAPIKEEIVEGITLEEEITEDAPKKRGRPAK